MNIDAWIVIGFVIYALANGWYYRKKASRDLDEYFLAGRSLRGWQAGASMAATQYAADTPLLVTGLVATAGMFSLWRLWIYAFAFLAMAFVFAAHWRRAKVLTDAELIELRYSGRLALAMRTLKAIHLGTFINCTVLAMVLLATARISEPFLFWDQWLPTHFFEPILHWVEHHNIMLSTLTKSDPHVWISSTNNFITIFVILIFTWSYSTTGGLRSVVSTDLLQLAFMLVGTAAYAWIVIDRVGGAPQLVSKLGALYGAHEAARIVSFAPPSWSDATILFALVISVQWWAQVNADGTGYLAQRSMACRTDRDAMRAGVIFTLLQIVVRSLCWLPIAIGLLILYPVESFTVQGEALEVLRVSREATFAQGIHDFLPIGLRGIMLTAMLAAVASTVDTHLNWGSSYWTNDIYKRLIMEHWLKRKPKGHELVWVARLSNVAILMLALALSVRLQSIQTAWHISLLFGGGLGLVLILRWLWYRINLYSEISAVVSSLVLACILLFGFPDLSEEARLLWMVLLSSACVITVTLLTRPEKQETLIRFYKQVRPLGFWKPIQQAAGLAPEAYTLKNALLATLTAGLSTFGLLVGLSRCILYGSQLHAWPLTLLLLVGALALMPFWLKPLMSKYQT